MSEFKKSAITELFGNSLAEIDGYIQEMEKYEQEKKQSGEEKTANKKKEKKTVKTAEYGDKDPIPRAEAVLQEDETEETDKKNNDKETKKARKRKDDTKESTEDLPFGDSKEDDEQEGEKNEFSDSDILDQKNIEDIIDDADETNEDDTAEDQQVNKKTHFFAPSITKARHDISSNVIRMPHFQEYDPLAPVLSLAAAKEASRAMHELRMVQRNHRPYLLVCIRDDGHRICTRFFSEVEAQKAMDEAMEAYIDEIDPIDTNKVIVVAETPEERSNTKYDDVMPPTPKEAMNPDGTLKRQSEIDGSLHRIREDDKGIIYFVDRNATARWDLINLDGTEFDDFDRDPEFREFVISAKEAQEQEKAANDKKDTKDRKNAENVKSSRITKHFKIKKNTR